MASTGVYRGDAVVDALRSAGGEASTEQIAERAGLGHIEALVTCGQLGAKNLIEKLSTGTWRVGNPRWRLKGRR